MQLQSTSLFNKITPREALDLYGSYYPRRRPTAELLELVQLVDKADAYHVTLSGGQQQRLAVALALVNEPELVFLDEPTTGLDPQARRSLWDVVRRMKAEGRTVILTTHYMEEAEALCDRLAIMDHGRILTSGTPAGADPGARHPERRGAGVRGCGSRKPRRSRRSSAVRWRSEADCGRSRPQDPKALLPILLDTAEAESVPFEQIHVRRATLEDVFLHRTGRSLRE